MNKIIPAIEGGKPERQEYLIFGKPEITETEFESVRKVLESGWLSTGPLVKKFEEKIKEIVGCNNAIAVNSCTSALHLALLSHNIGKGDEVIVTPMTFVATVNVIEHTGAKPIFVDIQEDTYNIDPKKIEEAITSKTKAIIPVHFAGLPCDMDEINSIANKNNLIVIEDAAHALGATYKKEKIGEGINDTAFSFYSTKNIAAGEGGILCIKDDERAEKTRIYSNHGMSKNAWERYSKSEKKRYEIVCPGYKYNMQDLNASIALPQLDRIEGIIERRKKFAAIYLDAFKDFDILDMPPNKSDRKNVWHLFPVLLNIDKVKITRNQFLMALHAENIGAGIHYEAIHEQPFYKEKYKINKGDCMRASYVSERTISLPLQTSMSEEDLKDVIRAVKKILNYYRSD